jgi:thioredoxin 1
MAAVFQHIKKVKMNSSFNNIINSEKPVLVDFYAIWCGPCKVLGPVLKEVKDNLGDKVSIIKIDVDKNQQLASQYQVRGVPTMILFQNGKQLWRQSGVLDKSDIIKIILEKSNQ